MSETHTRHGLSRTLGTPSLIFYGIGMILGAGIYSVIGAAAGVAGNSLWLSFVISAAVATLTALSYSELSTLFPEAGAAYVYLREAFPRAKWLAFATALLVAFSAISTVPTVALAFAGYLSQFVSVPAPVILLLFIAVIAAMAVIGVEESSRANIIFTLIETGGLVLFIAIALANPGFGEPIASGVSLERGTFAGAALVFFAYLGFENIANLAEEAKDPARSLPVAILGSVVVTTLLYVLVGIAAVSLLPAAELAASSAPLADAARRAAPWSPQVLSAIALFATANTALISLIVSSRILFSIARQGELPVLLSRTLPRRCSPWAATLVCTAIAACLLPLGEVEVVAGLTSFSSLVAFAGVNLTVIVLRFKRPTLPRPFRVPFTLGQVPVPAALGLLSTIAMISQLETSAHIIGTAAIAVIALLHVLYSSRAAVRVRNET